ncbi:hypothetical protein ACFW17_23710 [Streptomyces sp. NPDC058961]|uniref:hypothetical protein n=1 Tax=Streptomyces sp. NPDC058961 TaxID=3346680 RepID=UPI0036AFAA40
MTDADGDKADLSFEVWTTDANGNAKDRVKLTDANTYGILVSDFVVSGKSAEVLVPYGKLKPGVTYTFHTSAYDGTLYETTWSPWAKFRIRGHAVDIKLPEPDKAAPGLDLDAYQEPQEAKRTVTAPTLRKNAPGQGENCTEIGNNKISCQEVGDYSELTKEQKAFVERRLTAAKDASDLVSWCGDTASGVDWFKRTEACMKRATPIHEIAYSKLPNGQVIKVGEATFASVIQMKLDPQSTTFQQEWTVIPVDFTDFEGKKSEWGPVTVAPVFSCEPQCSTSSPVWRGFPTWSTTGTDLHTAVATLTHTASGTDTNKVSQVAMTWKWTASLPDAQNLGGGDLGKSTPDLDVRCDKVAEPLKPGCVFPAYKPTWVFNTKRYPLAAAHAWLMQSKLANHPGSKAAGKPMKYLPTDPTKNAPGRNPNDNRQVICPSGWAKAYGNPNTTPVDSTDLLSCDEYAFAATYNSGGMPTSKGGLNEVLTGNDCVQTYGTRVQQGEWHLYDDDRVASPSWREVCGRSAMSNDQNTGSMAAFPTTFSGPGKYHLLDTDEYWVRVPGFEHCDASKATVNCTYPKP